MFRNSVLAYLSHGRIPTDAAADVGLGWMLLRITSTFMASARAHCPECRGPDVVDLADLLYSARTDYYRCRSCGCWWMLPKNADEPATRIVLADARSAEKAG